MARIPHPVFLLGLLLLSCFTTACGRGTGNNNSNRCIAQERAALLQFKEGIQADTCGLLTSWGEEEDKRECCKWNGILCSNRTGHVIVLDLRGVDASPTTEACLIGNISPSLQELKHLRYLDLSNNNFRWKPIPSFIGSLTKLRYLNLSNAGFMGEIPHHLGNLTSLTYLDVGANCIACRHEQILHVENLWWLSRLTFLRYLDFSYADLSKASADWFHIISRLSFLTDLGMGWCNLSPTTPSSLLYVNSTTSLRTLHLDGNDFDFQVFPWFFNLSRINTHLVEVDLSHNQLEGPIPDKFSNLKHLAYLDLSWNNLRGHLPENLGDLCSLQVLSLGGNNLTEQLTSIVQTLSGCAHLELQALDLSSNALWGSLSDSGIFSRLSLLRQLDLSRNKLDGTISEDIRELSKLEYLDLCCNSLEGEISRSHFAGLSRLQYLSLANNHDLVLNFSGNWLPPFTLDTINLRSCILGPQFPKWLQSQKNFTYLDISHSRILDSVPLSFWSLLQPNLVYLNMSNNNISGTFPDKPINFAFFPLLDLSSNSLEGAAPVFQGNVRAVILSNNMFQNAAPLLCPTTDLMFLTAIDLSNNLLSGELRSDCWIHMDRLEILHLENNKLSGRLPSFYGLQNLKSLHLRNNSFSGGLPSSLKYCSSMVLLDLGFNSLSGYISPGLENNFPSSLIVLSLRQNNFLGSIPPSLCQLSSLQILDLSFNNLSGAIPEWINCLLGMKETPDGSRAMQGSLSIDYVYNYGGIFNGIVYQNEQTDAASLVWKGTEISYMKNLRPVKMIDISSNVVEGDIPDTISFLTGLVSLNLSRNNLTGNITENIGRLNSLESLDLSSNQLSGEIPASLSTLSFLGVLDVSNNNLSGEIPSGTQLQGFDPSTYMGNPELCGKPLPRNCPGGQALVDSATEKSFGQQHDDDDSYVFPGLYISIILGFITGFWAVCGTLVLKRSCRDAYFQWLGDTKDRIYVATILWMKPQNLWVKIQLFSSSSLKDSNLCPLIMQMLGYRSRL